MQKFKSVQGILVAMAIAKELGHLLNFSRTFPYAFNSFDRKNFVLLWRAMLQCDVSVDQCVKLVKDYANEYNNYFGGNDND